MSLCPVALTVVCSGLLGFAGVGLGFMLARRALRGFELAPHREGCGCATCEAFRKAGL